LLQIYAQAREQQSISIHFFPMENIWVRTTNEFLYFYLFKKLYEYQLVQELPQRRNVQVKCNARLGRLMIQDVFDLSLKSTKVLRDLHDSCCYAIHLL